MTAKNEIRTIDDWQPITLSEIRKQFNQDFFKDIKSLILSCEKMDKPWTIDIFKGQKIILVAVVSEDLSWIYEIEGTKDQFYRQIFLARDDLHFLIRRMNEKRSIRKV